MKRVREKGVTKTGSILQTEVVFVEVNSFKGFHIIGQVQYKPLYLYNKKT